MKIIRELNFNAFLYLKQCYYLLGDKTYHTDTELWLFILFKYLIPIPQMNIRKKTCIYSYISAKNHSFSLIQFYIFTLDGKYLIYFDKNYGLCR